MKKFKIVILIIFVLLLSSCGEEEYNEYVSKVGNGISCRYVPKESENVLNNIKSITFNATKEKIVVNYELDNDYAEEIEYVVFPLNNKGEITGKPKVKNDHKLITGSVLYSDFKYEDYLKDYDKNSSCPDIYLSDDSSGATKVYTSYSNGMVTYSTNQNNTNNNSNNNSGSSSQNNTNNNSGSSKNPGSDDYVIQKTCNVPNAKACRNYAIPNTVCSGGKTTYIELAVVEENGTFRKCFWVKNVSHNYHCFDGYQTQENIGPLKNNLCDYYIRSSDINRLYTMEYVEQDGEDYGRWSFIDSDLITIDEKTTNSSNYFVNITAKGSPTIEEYKGYKDLKDADEIKDWYEEKKDQIPDPIIVPTGCESLFGSPKDKYSPAWYLSFAFKIIKYVAIVLLIVISVMDFIGATAAQDPDALKKATGKAIKRLIICVIIFLLPILIEFLLELISEKQTDMCINSTL